MESLQSSEQWKTSKGNMIMNISQNSNFYFSGWYNMKVGERQQQGRGKTQKIICPKCAKEYLKTAWMLENKKFKRVGLCCPSSSCDYIIKDAVDPGDDEEENETA